MKQKNIERLLSYNKIDKKKMMEIEKLRASCDHKKVKGGETRSALKLVDEDNSIYKCSICGESIKLNEIPQDKIKEAVSLLTNVIEAIKVAEDDISEKALDELGGIILFLERLPKVYKTLVAERLHEEEYECNTDMGIQNMGMMNPMFQQVMANPLYYSGAYKHNKNKNKNKHKNKKHKNKGYDSRW